MYVNNLVSRVSLLPSPEVGEDGKTRDPGNKVDM